MRASSGSAPQPPLDATIKALNPYSVAEMDWISYGSTGKVYSLREKVRSGGIANPASHAYVQSNTAKQVAAPAAYANLNNALAGTFTGAEYYQSNAAASTWTFLHDGTGAEMFVVFEKTGGGTYYLVASHNTTAGFDFQTAANLTGSVLDAAGGYVIFAASAALTWANEKYVSMSYATSDTPDFTQNRRATAAGTDNNRLTPASTAPQGSLMIGASTTGAAPFVGAIACVMVWNRVLSAGERTTVRAYITSKYGVT